MPRPALFGPAAERVRLGLGEEVSEFEKFGASALQGLTLGHFTPEVAKQFPEQFEGVSPATTGGNIVGGLIPVIAASALLGPELGFGLIGGLRPAGSGNERIKNIVTEASLGRMFKVLAPETRAFRAAFLGGTGAGLTAIEGGKTEDILVSGGIMAMFGGLGKTKGVKPKPSKAPPVDGVKTVTETLPNGLSPMQQTIGVAETYRRAGGVRAVKRAMKREAGVETIQGRQPALFAEQQFTGPEGLTTRGPRLIAKEALSARRQEALETIQESRRGGPRQQQFTGPEGVRGEMLDPDVIIETGPLQLKTTVSKAGTAADVKLPPVPRTSPESLLGFQGRGKRPVEPVKPRLSVFEKRVGSEERQKIIETLQQEEINKTLDIENRTSLDRTLRKIESDAKHRLNERFKSLNDITSAPAALADLAVIGAAKIGRGIVSFKDWAADMVREFGNGIKTKLQAIWRRSQEVIKEFQGEFKGGLKSRSGAVPNPFASAPQQRQIGRVAKGLKLKDTDVNQIARNLGASRGASRLAKEQVSQFKNELRTFNKEGRGIGKDNPLRREINMEFFTKNRGFSAESKRKFIKRHTGKERLRDLDVNEAKAINELVKNISTEPDVMAPDQVIPRAEKIISTAKDVLSKYTSEIIGRPAKHFSKTKDGRRTVEDFGLAKAYSAEIAGPLKRIWEDALETSAPKIHEIKFQKWMGDNFKSYVETFGRSPKPPPEYASRVETLRQSWRAVKQPIADLAKKMGVKGFKEIEGEDYHPDQLTIKARDALKRKQGPLFDAISKEAKVNGLDDFMLDEIFQGIREHKVGALENPRVANLPGEVTVDGKQVRVLSGGMEPLADHIRKMSNRLGLIRVFGQGDLGDILKARGRGHAEEMTRKGRSFSGEFKKFTEFVNEFQSPNPGELPRVLQPAVNLIRGGQLSMAAIPNFIMGPLPAIVKFHARTAIKNLFEAMKGSDRVNQLREWDAWHKDALAANMDVADLGGFTGVLTKKFLGVLGFNYANRLVNKFSALQAMDFFESAAKKGNRAELEQLFDDYNFSRARIEDIVNTRRLTDIDKIQIAERTAALMNVTGETSLERQPWMNTPLAKSLLTYSSFVRRYGEIAADAIIKAKNGDPRQLTKFLLGNLAGAEATIWVKNWLKGKEREDEGVYMHIFNNLLYSGAAGLGGEAVQRIFFGAKYRQSLQELGGGPLPSAINEFYQDIIAAPIKGEAPKIEKLFRRNVAIAPVIQNILQGK